MSINAAVLEKPPYPLHTTGSIARYFSLALGYPVDF